MGTTTVTTVTCDVCSLDITTLPQFWVSASVSAANALVPDTQPEGEPPSPPVHVPPVMLAAVLCEEHGGGVLAKLRRAIPTTKEED